MVFSDTVYDKLKWFASYFMPPLTALWIACADAWGFPYASQIGATLAAITTFLNGLLGLSNANYEGDGEITIDTDDGYKVTINTPVKDISSKKRVSLKVNKGD